MKRELSWRSYKQGLEEGKVKEMREMMLLNKILIFHSWVFFHRF